MMAMEDERQRRETDAETMAILAAAAVAGVKRR